MKTRFCFKICLQSGRIPYRTFHSLKKRMGMYSEYYKILASGAPLTLKDAIEGNFP